MESDERNAAAAGTKSNSEPLCLSTFCVRNHDVAIVWRELSED